MKEYILGIDPSNKTSSYTLVELPSLKLIEFGFKEEDDMLDYVENIVCDDDKIIYLAIEGLQNLGLPTGKSVFDTAYLVGRLLERAKLVPYLDGYWEYTDTCDRLILGHSYKDIKIIYRKEEKMALCNTMRAKDKDIRRVLIDKFATHDFKNGKGTKKNPDWFYGFARDNWQSYAICYTYYELYYKRGVNNG